METIIVFDVNETLLDLQPVRGWFSSRCDDQPSAAMWFSELLRLSSAFATTAERFNASICDGDISHKSRLIIQRQGIAYSRACPNPTLKARTSSMQMIRRYS